MAGRPTEAERLLGAELHTANLRRLPNIFTHHMEEDLRSFHLLAARVRHLRLAEWEDNPNHALRLVIRDAIDLLSADDPVDAQADDSIGWRDFGAVVVLGKVELLGLADVPKYGPSTRQSELKRLLMRRMYRSMSTIERDIVKMEIRLAEKIKAMKPAPSSPSPNLPTLKTEAPEEPSTALPVIIISMNYVPEEDKSNYEVSFEGDYSMLLTELLIAGGEPGETSLRVKLREDTTSISYPDKNSPGGFRPGFLQGERLRLRIARDFSMPIEKFVFEVLRLGAHYIVGYTFSGINVNTVEDLTDLLQGVLQQRWLLNDARTTESFGAKFAQSPDFELSLKIPREQLDDLIIQYGGDPDDPTSRLMTVLTRIDYLLFLSSEYLHERAMPRLIDAYLTSKSRGVETPPAEIFLQPGNWLVKFAPYLSRDEVIDFVLRHSSYPSHSDTNQTTHPD